MAATGAATDRPLHRRAYVRAGMPYGYGSYHIDWGVDGRLNPSGCFVSFELMSDDVAFDDGTPLRTASWVTHFQEPAYDAAKRRFTGTVILPEGKSFRGATRMRYRLVFSEDFTTIEQGAVDRASGDGEWAIDDSPWEPMRIPPPAAFRLRNCTGKMMRWRVGQINFEQSPPELVPGHKLLLDVLCDSSIGPGEPFTSTIAGTEGSSPTPKSPTKRRSSKGTAPVTARLSGGGARALTGYDVVTPPLSLDGEHAGYGVTGETMNEDGSWELVVAVHLERELRFVDGADVPHPMGYRNLVGCEAYPYSRVREVMDGAPITHR